MNQIGFLFAKIHFHGAYSKAFAVWWSSTNLLTMKILAAIGNQEWSLTPGLNDHAIFSPIVGD
jgi:hypothetical protein